MEAHLQSYIQSHRLCNSGTPVLLACSGGVDSMVLATLLHGMDYKIAIAHCNFQLRGADSDADEEFVRAFAASRNLPFFTVRFDTLAFKKEKQLSTQMVARELRYQWLEEIRKNNGYHAIATAHHLDDQLETILLNISKGTGLRGLSGMAPRNGYLIRPMLTVNKKDILQFAAERNIAFREDSSNATDDYQRNLIRHQVVPPLQQINPSLHATISDFISRMHDYQQLTDAQIQLTRKKCYSENNGIAEIKTGYLRVHPAGQTILFHLLESYGFNKDHIARIYRLFTEPGDTASGQQFFSDSHRIVMDRKSLFIVPKDTVRDNYKVIEQLPDQIIFNNYKIQCSVLPVHELNMKQSERYAYFDADKIRFPLSIRYAAEGDYFYPLGLSKPKTPGKAGKKKLSKYFKDQKLSQIEKENTPLLFSGEHLIWLIGHRTDDRFKVTEKTTRVLKMLVADR